MPVGSAECGVKVWQQAVSQRFLEFPAQLFERVLQDLLPVLSARWSRRERRPMPEGVKLALVRFERVWIVDGSTLEALFGKLERLQDHKLGTLAGKIGVVLDLVTRLPVAVWFERNPHAHAHWTHQRWLSRSAVHRDHLIQLGKGYKGNPILSLRLVEVNVGPSWRTYLTSVADPTVLPPFVVANMSESMVALWQTRQLSHSRA